jgi:hypothetical protein
MKLFKKIQVKIQTMSIPGAMLMSGLIVGLSIFISTWVFFGGDNNRQKLSVKNPALNKPAQQANQLSAQQIQQIQQQRAQQQQNTPTTVVKPATTTPAKAPVKK